MKYNHEHVEKKWQEKWEQGGANRARENTSKKKFYALIEFPYPSGEGLHVGHIRSNTAMDIVARKRRAQGYEVLYPIGWDAFGLPTENYAIKTGIEPAIVTKNNTDTFRRQLKSLGFSFDWSREINTTDPKYYKWTQWIFLQLFKHGLAYKARIPVNWCPKDKIVLANEEVVDGCCERCGTAVEKREKEQWMLAITKYAERLEKDLDLVDYLPKIKIQQRNWIGRSEGAEIDFPIAGAHAAKDVFIATNNRGKIERFKKLLTAAGITAHIHTPESLGIVVANIEENGKTLRENAELKARAYFGRVNMPILGNDTGFYVEGEGFIDAPKRAALAGESEASLSEKEISEKLLRFWKDIATKHGGKANAAWRESFVLLEPSGIIRSADSQREVVLTDTEFGEAHMHMPVRALYYSKATGKPAIQHTEEEELLEMQPVTDALKKLLIPSITVFTTRADTLFGATYLVLSPEHTQIRSLEPHISNKEEVSRYIAAAKKKAEIERTAEGKEKTGVELKGVRAINPANNEEIPIFVADYVLAQYGTGAIMAVPAHDERDFEFAEKFGLAIKPVILKKTDASLSFVMGIDEKALRELGADIQEKTKDGFFKILIPFSKLDAYKSFIRERMRPGFWNEFSTQTGFYFIFKHKDGKLEEMELNEKTNGIIDRYGMTFNDKEPNNAPENVYMWLAKNSFYKQILLHTEDGILINSNVFNGLSSDEAKKKITEFVGGKLVTTYKLRDWVFSRQRYWGEPIPLIQCKKDGWVPVPEEQLPVELPAVKKYQPTDTGESPLANIPSWVNTTCPACGGPAQRETDVMPNWAGSSWYFLRYCDPHNDEVLAGKEKLKYWTPVDWYNGGMEHTTLHLLYSRFWHKFLFDIGAAPTSEPYAKRTSHGLILAGDGSKMSKSKGNTVNPDELVSRFGADSLRLYEMFMGPFDQPIAWNTDGVVGTRRFLERVWKLADKKDFSADSDEKLNVLLNQTVKKVGEDIEHLKMNTAVSQMMIFLNAAEQSKTIGTGQVRTLVRLLAPFAPHIAEELWQKLGGENSVHEEPWPAYDEEALQGTTVAIAVQVNGKSRAVITVKTGSSNEEVEAEARREQKVAAWLTGTTVVRTIIVPGRLVNFVLADN